MSQEVYAITDVDGYIHQMREAAAKSLSEDGEEENLDEFISAGQMLNMIKKECVGFDDQDRPLLDENSNERIYENTAVWIHNVGLAKLAAQDLIECAWDDESNEMIFWAKKKVSNNVESSKPKSKNKRKNKDS